jgi:hypothetical protein
MAVRQRRYSKEELARRGQELYEAGIRQQVESGNTGKIVAIDIETGAFEVADHVLPATNQLFKRYPDAQPWVIRIGHRAVYHFGSRRAIWYGALMKFNTPFLSSSDDRVESYR